MAHLSIGDIQNTVTIANPEFLLPIYFAFFVFVKTSRIIDEGGINYDL